MWHWLTKWFSPPARPPDTPSGLGQFGEERAAEFLRREKGYKIICRNWRGVRGEIDIVAWDGPILVFVEVRARKAGALVPGYHTITRRKKRTLLRACQDYLAAMRPPPTRFRLDVVEASLRPPDGCDLRHYQNEPLFPKNYHPD